MLTIVYKPKFEQSMKYALKKLVKHVNVFKKLMYCWNVNKRRKFPIENYEHLKQTELWNYAIIYSLVLWDMT